MITAVCADTVNTVAAVSALEPHIVAIEPPELIGTGISVSSAKPEIITRAIESVRKVNSSVAVVAGAGISTEKDVRRAVELGACGALVASAVVKSDSRRELIFRMASELAR
jgi:triosephosphate isomerase